MTLENLAAIVGNLPAFDIATLMQMTGEDRAAVINQLYRWSRAGKIIPLRRGLYTLGDLYRRTPIPAPLIANILHRPSYISGLWALSYFGLIPESVPVYTNVTTRTPREFENPFGRFEYRNIKQDFFFGYTETTIMGSSIIIASMEKALIDLFHLTPGEWTFSRVAEMRFQQTDLVDHELLRSHAERMDKPRLIRAVEEWLKFSERETEGDVEL